MATSRAPAARALPILLAALAAAVSMVACAAKPFEDVSITAVELREAPKLEFLRARVGMKFLEVRFEMENRAREVLQVKALDFSLRDDTGKVHPYSAQVLDMGQPRGTVVAQVPAGVRVPGSVVFQIPQEAQPAALIYKREMAGGLAVSLKP